jgi:large repetitive protein
MNKTSTLSYPFLLSLCLLFFARAIISEQLYAQCSTQTPVYEVNLTGQPGGVWTSPIVNRRGSCCDSPSNQNCVQFNVTLDRLSAGLQFSIISGPVPSGSMSYQLGCGTRVPVGDSICVTGPGPHQLTICMPGNAENTFRIRSIAAFVPVSDVTVVGGCSATLTAPVAFVPSSIRWNDITGGGQYNKYLSCLTGCATTIVTPDADAPAFVDYSICGNSTSSGCANRAFCDTVRVYFKPPVQVTINPKPAIICPGSSGVDLSGTAIGGDGGYRYSWTNAAGTVLATTQNYRATAIGKYYLAVRSGEGTGCRTFRDSVTVVQNLAVNAGSDQVICSQNTAQLNATVTGATGGIWSGGTGTFAPSNTALNAIYTPSAAEVAAGRARLILTSTGNGSCAAVTDDITITIRTIQVAITAPAVVCNGGTTSISTTVTGGATPYRYLWSTGETTSAVHNKPAGVYSVRVTDNLGCIITSSVTIGAANGPTDLTLLTEDAKCTGAGKITVTAVTGGTEPYTYSRNGTTFQASAVFDGLAAGDYTITVMDANGCRTAKTTRVAMQEGPNPITASTQPASCANNDGFIEVAPVTGGRTPYLYSLDGVNYQVSRTFNAVASGAYTVRVRDINGCVVSTAVTVAKLEPTAVAFSAKQTTCGADDGEINVTSVTGGVEPYTYSINGVTFQSTGNFSGLFSGEYTLIVKDANGCSFSVLAEVGDLAGPVGFTAVRSATTCGQANGQISISAVEGGTAPYTYSLDGITFQESATFANLVSGDHLVTVKDSRGCRYLSKETLENIPGPTFLTTTLTSSTCGGANGILAVATVVGGTGPYRYSLSGTTFQDSATFTGLRAGEYAVTVQDANGCSYTRSAILEDIAGPSGFTIAVRPSTCGVANGQLSVSTVDGGIAPYQYSKDGTNFQESATFTGLIAGAYTITVKDANGCTWSNTEQLTDIAGPSGLTAEVKASTCGDANGEVSISAVQGGTAPYSYSITGSVFQNHAVFAGLNAGTYTITVKDANNCITTRSVVVNNQAGATAAATTVTPSACTSHIGTISITGVSGGRAPYQYSLNGTTYQESTSFTGLAPVSYTLFVKDANACVSPFTVIVGTNGPTSAVTSVKNAACGQNDGEVTVSRVNGGSSPYTYSIDGTTFQSLATFRNLAAGVYTITIKDAQACLLTVAALVNNPGGPAGFTLTATDESCDRRNGEVRVSAITGGTSPYTYSINGTDFINTTTFTGLAAGTHYVTVKDASGCLLSKPVSVQNRPAPHDIRFSRFPAMCGNSNGKVFIHAVSGGTGPYSYSVDGITFTQSDTLPGIAAGSYQLTVRDANGCTYAEPLIIEGIEGPQGIRLETFIASCSQNDGRLSIIEVQGGVSPYLYSLDGDQYQVYPEFTNLSHGSYLLYVKDANGCVLTQDIAIQKAGTVVGSVRGITCFGAHDGSISLLTVGATDYTEYSINGGRSYQKEPVFVNLDGGFYNIWVRHSQGCFITIDSVRVNEPEQIKATVTQLTKAIGRESNGSAMVSGVSGGIKPYTYKINSGTFSADTVFASLATGTHVLTVRDERGCEEVFSFTIDGLVDIDIPNAFTPNGDGINDRWVLKNLAYYFPECKVTVFNRWGSPVYETVGYKQDWDGTHNGRKLPDGTYYFIILLNDAEAPVKGSVTLIR